MPPIFSFQLKTTFPKIRKKSWRKRNVFTPLLTVGTNSWGLFENMWGFLFVMIRLLDVVAVEMEKDGGCWWCFVCFSEDMKPRLNSGRTDGNVSLCSSKTLRCYFQVTECLSIFLFFFPPAFSGSACTLPRQIRRWFLTNSAGALGGTAPIPNPPLHNNVGSFVGLLIQFKSDIKAYLYVAHLLFFYSGN